jgi:hypothetical protein
MAQTSGTWMFPDGNKERSNPKVKRSRACAAGTERVM